MTKEEKLVVTAYTGVLMVSYDEYQEFVTKLLKRPVYTHELAFEDMQAEIRKAVLPQFLAIIRDEFETQSKTPLVENKYPPKDTIIAFLLQNGCIEEKQTRPQEKEACSQYLRTKRYEFAEREDRKYLVVHIGYDEKSKEFAHKLLTEVFTSLTKEDAAVFTPSSGYMMERAVVFPLNDSACDYLKRC